MILYIDDVILPHFVMLRIYASSSVFFSSIQHLSALPTGLDADSDKDNGDTDPLPECQLVLKEHDAEQHGEQFARDCHHDERQASKVGNSLKNEELP